KLTLHSTNPDANGQVGIDEPTYLGQSELQTARTTYDPATGQVVDTFDQYDSRTRNTYDATGNLIGVSYANGTATRTVYDKPGRVIWQTDAFVGSGESSSPSDRANATHTVYDNQGRVVRTERYIGVRIDMITVNTPKVAPETGDYTSLRTERITSVDGVTIGLL